MILLIRFLAFVLFWIGSKLQWLIHFLNKNESKAKIPKIENEILFYSAAKLISKLKSGEISSEKLVRAYIKRIKEVNPALNAVIEDRFSDAVEDARKADKVLELTLDKDDLFKKYPLFGIPFTVKESCGVEGLSHVVGNHYRRGKRATEDGATIVLLKKAGAIPLLVSANSELCVSWETDTFINGRCCNPFNINYSPGGSSGGEGALNGVGASVFGIGSDLCGSIRIPAMFNGLYGHKPTGELSSGKGHFPSSENGDNIERAMQVGPITRFVEDLPLLVDLIVGKNKEKLLEAADINEMKIFYMDLNMSVSVLPVCKSVKESIEKACDYFKSRGNVVQKLEIEEMKDIMEIVITTLKLFVPPSILKNHEEPEKSTTYLAELQRHLKGKPLHTLATLYFEFLYDFSGVFDDFNNGYYIKRRDDLKSKLQEALKTDGVLIFPTFHRPAFLHNTSIIHSPACVLTGLSNVIGFPSLHVPTGLNRKGLPIGFQIIAAPYSDRNCFRVATEINKIFGGWIPPL